MKPLKNKLFSRDLKPLFFLSLMLITPVLAQYDSRPLRSPLAAEPHFQTSLGREGHRFEGYPINRYNLYDFYARQAQYWLSKGETPDLLLPYPGLQGGRQGHWGNTNEALYSAVTDRTKEPEYHRLTIRRGGHYLSFNPSKSVPRKALGIFDAAGVSMRFIVIDGSYATPLHVFSHTIDRFGFSLAATTGHHYFLNLGAEWFTSPGHPSAISPIGYYVNGEKVIYHRKLENAEYLDFVDLNYVNEVPIYTRTFEWLGDSPRLSFTLPLPGAEFTDAETTAQIKELPDGLLITRQGPKFAVNYLIRSTSKTKEMPQVEEKDLATIHFPACKKGDRWLISSWIVAAGAADLSPQLPAIPTPSEFLKGGVPYYGDLQEVAGQLNVEPAAKGSGYTLDNIPVPMKNSYGVPMTASGLAFDRDGTAYISTLVGDIWRVSGIDDSLKKIVWKRYASGISMPLGLEMVDGVLYVAGEGGITRLHDLNKDGEADYYERFTEMPLQLGAKGSENQNLERDAAGNFYMNGRAGVMRISPDGKTANLISGVARNPLGLGVRADGLALSDSSEGLPNNGTCTIYESQHPENEKSVSTQKRILYLPRGVDNSPGSRLFMNSQDFGPLGQSIIGTSYGTGQIYQILRDPNQGTPQAAVMLLPMEVSSGAARIALNPKDNNVYIVGMDGWGDLAVEEGSFNRMRYTGEPCLRPIAWKSYKNGIAITFNTEISPASVQKSKSFLQQWNYIDSVATYGSPEYSVKQPNQLGHDHITIDSIHLSENKKELFIAAPTILPSMTTQIYSELEAVNGAKLQLNLFATLNQLNDNHPAANDYAGEKPLNLLVPSKANNGNTYTNITNFFDKRAGRDILKREAGPVVNYTPENLNYQWISENVLQKNLCFTCHATSTQHDLSTYESIIKYVNLQAPAKSPLYSMMISESMPPAPVPNVVAPAMRAAVLQWIQGGAKK